MSKSTSNEGEGGDALIHLRVSPALKGRWVRESRAAGMRLTDWIVSRVEAQPMEKVTPVCIPQGMVLQNSVQTRRNTVAQVVYTHIDRIEDLPSAKWSVGVQDSYAETQRVADGGRGVVSIIGRRADDGSVQLAYAKTGRSPWFVVGAWHLKLAQFFSAKMETAPDSPYLRPFFDDIDDTAAAHAAKQLVGAEVGINKEYGRDNGTHDAILKLCAAVSALARIPDGDWMFCAVRKTVYGV